MTTKKRSTAGKSGSKLEPPEGLSYEEEAQWFHDHREYWDQLDTPLEYHPNGLPVRRSEAVTVYLPADLMEDLRAEAERRSVSWQRLMTDWLDAQLAAERR